jgi:hypothetical protein
MRSIAEYVDMGLEAATTPSAHRNATLLGVGLVGTLALGVVAVRPWIQREGKLGGPGYTTKPERERHRLLHRAVDKYGYRSTLGSLQVLLRGHGMATKKEHVIERDKRWLAGTFGGPGSFS